MENVLHKSTIQYNTIQYVCQPRPHRLRTKFCQPTTRRSFLSTSLATAGVWPPALSAIPAFPPLWRAMRTVRYGTVVYTIFLKEVLVLKEETINNHHSHCISRGMRGNCHTIDECRNFERMGQIEDLIPCPRTLICCSILAFFCNKTASTQFPVIWVDFELGVWV